MMLGIFRSGWWPGHKPTIDRGRKMCSDCRYHNPVPAGWEWDRCHHPDADLGSIVRNDQLPTCADVRLSSAQCGYGAKWFDPKRIAAETAASDENISPPKSPDNPEISE